MGKNQHVVMQGERWAIQAEGEIAPWGLFKTQGEAWEKAKALARKERSEAILHGRDGTGSQRLCKAVLGAENHRDIDDEKK